MTMFGGGDVGWAGSYVPLVVSEGALEELRNLAGPPQHPGAKMVMIDLETGKFKWYTAPRRSYGTGGQRARGRSRRR